MWRPFIWYKIMKNNTEFAKLYSVITQGFITILVLIGLGFFIGYKINKNSPWPIILAVVGGLIGIASMIIIIVKYLLDDTIKSSEDIEKYLGISTLALIPMNRAEDENSDKRKSSNNNNGKVMKSLNDAKSKIFKS